ncbi:peptide chain release factor family protein [Nonomuraea sp. NPDC051941]|uniref:peptide chain release factor family protein n=1 Tax=Nonomuraea sp. NPDC051941 TaxID=3364373 RepID=UPI0037C9938B
MVACRTGGPGGQHRNKAGTAVRATHRSTGIVVVVDTERQFSLNRRIAMRLLRQRIEHADEAGRTVTTARFRRDGCSSGGRRSKVRSPDRVHARLSGLTRTHDAIPSHPPLLTNSVDRRMYIPMHIL